MSSTEKISKMYYIRPRFGDTPRTKTAAQELIKTAPDHVLLVSTAPQLPDFPSIELKDVQPGETIRYTDGSGRYYGTLTRSLDGDGFVFDAK